MKDSKGEDIPLTPPMLAIAAAGNDAADEENVAAHAVAGSPAETEWVVPIPVSPITDWRPWPSVPAPSPIRDPTPSPISDMQQLQSISNKSHSRNMLIGSLMLLSFVASDTVVFIGEHLER
ncbi:hypothetical protein Tco_0100300 [Tanacetum coccineum]